MYQPGGSEPRGVGDPHRRGAADRPRHLPGGERDRVAVLRGPPRRTPSSQRGGPSMRTLPLLPVAALCAALAACGGATASTPPAPLAPASAPCAHPTASTPPAPLAAGRYAATSDGDMRDTGEGTAYTYDPS